MLRYFAHGASAWNSSNIYMSSQIERLQIDLFRGNGYAEIIKEKNQSVHGILHEISEKELSILDEIEVFYDLEKETVELYDGHKIDNVFVCCRKYDEHDTKKNELP